MAKTAKSEVQDFFLSLAFRHIGLSGRDWNRWPSHYNLYSNPI